MKKSLVAITALAAVSAFAQSSVTLSGIIKGGVAQTKYSSGPVGSVNGNGLSVADGSSRFIIGGTEDLGGGLKAVFQIDTRFRMDDNGGAPTSSPLGAGNTFVGLSGGLGMVQIGKLDTHYCLGADQHGARATAQQASSCALLGYVGNVGASIANSSRTTNVIRYTTPNFSGFQGRLSYSTSFNGPEGAPGDAGKGRAMNAALNYGSGPLKAGVSIWDAKSESRLATATRADQEAYTLFADYNFGVATVGLTFDESKRIGGLLSVAETESKRRAWSIPVTVPLGAGTLLFTYTKARDLTGTAAPAVNANTGATLVSIGYDYALSKRTSLGVSYAKLNNQANAGYALYNQASANGTPNNAVGQDASQLYLGIRHAF